MTTDHVLSDLQPTVDTDSARARANELVVEHEYDVHARTDRMFAWLMGIQWIAGIVFAVWVSPLAWEGASSRVHLHVWAAIVVGGIITLFPAMLAVLRPGYASTRYTISVAQMLMGALLIHLTGGRIETHFHVFGSLAFLASYRDWRVLVPATIVVALDHLLRGALWPQSVYGVLVASQWRWLEHAGWVVFEDIILVMLCRRGVIEMRERAERTADLERYTAELELAHGIQERNAAQLTELVGELRVAQRNAEAATRAKSDFLASMSHELRTPLNAIILYSELVQEEAEESGYRQAAEDMQKVTAAGRHLLELINGILDLSKIEAGKMTISPETFDVAPMLAELGDTITPLVNKNHNTLVVRCGPDAGVMTTDPTHTRQILLNLLSNAAKFTKNGSITLSARAIVLDGYEYVEFAVEDTGIGMTPQQAGKVFEPFTQADVTTTRKYGGTGLGLALVSRFCRLMGGHVSVDSRVGEGSRFTVQLPRTCTEPGHVTRECVDAA